MQHSSTHSVVQWGERKKGPRDVFDVSWAIGNIILLNIIILTFRLEPGMIFFFMSFFLTNEYLHGDTSLLLPPPPSATASTGLETCQNTSWALLTSFVSDYHYHFNERERERGQGWGWGWGRKRGPNDETLFRRLCPRLETHRSSHRYIFFSFFS